MVVGVLGMHPDKLPDIKKNKNNKTMENITSDNNCILESFAEVATVQNIEAELIKQALCDGIEDIKKDCTVNEWKALLQAVGGRLFPKGSKLLKIDNNIFYNPSMNISSNNNKYDLYKIDKLCDIYIYLSHKYNKLIHLIYFGYLINCDANYIYILLDNNNNDNINDSYISDNYRGLYNSNNLTSIRLKIRQKLIKERENNLKEKCFESAGAVGAIAIGNVEAGWNTGQQQRAIDSKVTSVEALPQFNAIE